MKVIAADVSASGIEVALLNRRGDVLASAQSISDRKEDMLSALSTAIRSIITSDTAAIGIAIPGIIQQERGTVSSPDLELIDFPLQEKMNLLFPGTRVIPENSHTCAIMGEMWKGAAQRSRNAVFLYAGQTISAGIMVNCNMVKGARGAAGAVGNIILPAPEIAQKPYCFFDEFASTKGLVALGNLYAAAENEKEHQEHYSGYTGITDLIDAFEKEPPAQQAINTFIRLWSMGIANMVNLFNPDKIILGGEVFGPALSFINEIKAGVGHFVSFSGHETVQVTAPLTGTRAALLGAGYNAILSENY